jgi:hypothetical protein
MLYHDSALLGPRVDFTVRLAKSKIQEPPPEPQIKQYFQTGHIEGSVVILSRDYHVIKLQSYMRKRRVASIRISRLGRDRASDWILFWVSGTHGDFFLNQNPFRNAWSD